MQNLKYAITTEDNTVSMTLDSPLTFLYHGIIHLLFFFQTQTAQVQ